MGKGSVVPPLIQFAQLEKILNHARANSLWPLTFGLACCAIEMMAAAGPKYDLDRFGAGVFRASPRQADVMIVAGTVTHKMADTVKRLYLQMPAPKWVIAMGNCAMTGGPFKLDEINYSVVEGVGNIVPVDVYVPGCPPRPEALIEAFLKLEEKISGVRRFPEAPVVALPEAEEIS